MNRKANDNGCFEFALESFSLRVQTKDEYQVLLGGLCPPEQRSGIEASLLRIKEQRFGSFTDPYEVDVRFLQLIQTVHVGLEAGIKYILAGCIAVPNASDACGAVLGLPCSRAVSASEEENPVLLMEKPEIYSVCFPGSFGAAFAGTYEDAVYIAKQSEIMLTEKAGRPFQERVVSLIHSKTDIYAVCTDIQPTGFGTFKGGDITVSDHNKAQTLHFISEKA